MKLHLPKSLRSALLACLAAIAPVAVTVSTGTLTAGLLSATILTQQALGEDAVEGETTTDTTTWPDNSLIGAGYNVVIVDSDLTVDGSTAAMYDEGQSMFSTSSTDVVIVRLSADEGTSSWLAGGGTCNATYVYVDEWHTANGYSSGVYTFNSVFLGDGDISVGYQGGNYYTFNGDMSAWSGDFTNNTDNASGYSSYAYVTVTDDYNTSTQRVAITGTGSFATLGYLYYDCSATTIGVNNTDLTISGTLTFTGDAGVTYNVSSEVTTPTLVLGDSTKVNFGAHDGTGVTIAGTAITLGSSATLNVLNDATTGSNYLSAYGITMGDYSTINIEEGQGGEVRYNLTMSGADSSFNNAGTMSVFWVYTSGSGSSITNTGEMSVSYLAMASTDSTYYNSGTLTVDTSWSVTAEGQIINTGTFTVATTTSVYISNEIDWNYDTEGDYYYIQLVAGNGADLSNLTADNITNLITAGKENLTFTTDGYLTYTMAAPIYYTGGTLSLVDGASGFVDSSDVDTTFDSGESVTFKNNDSTVTVTGELSIPVLTIESGISLTIGASADGGSVDAALLSMADGSTLELASDVLTEESYILNAGSASIIFDASDSSTAFSYADVLIDYTDDIEVKSGTLDLATDSVYYFYMDDLTLGEGTGLNLVNTYIGATTFSLNGGEAGITLSACGATIANDVTMTGKVNIELTYTEDYAGSLYFYSDFYGSGTVTISNAVDGESAAIIQYGDVYHSGDLVLNSGVTYWFGYADSYTTTMAFDTITINEGGTFAWCHDVATLDSKIILNGGDFYSYDASATGENILSELEVSANSTFTLVWGATFRITELSGDADLTIVDGGVDYGESVGVIADLIVDYNGTITSAYGTDLGTDVPTFSINEVSTAQGITTTMVGYVHADKFSKTGEGMLDIETLVLEGSTLYMDYEGTLNIDSFSIVSTSYLSYANSGGSIISLDNATIADGVYLSLLFDDAITAQDLYDGLALGISSDIDESIITIFGYTDEQYSLTVENGYYTLYVVDGAGLPDASAYWDSNWGEDIIDSSPDTIPMVSIDGDLVLYDTTDCVMYDEDGNMQTSVNIIGGGTGEEFVFGGAAEYSSYWSTDYLGTSPVTLDSWILMSGGSVHAIVGQNYANNWYSGTVMNFAGDTHISYIGGDVNYIIGRMYKDGQGISSVGDVYISLYDSVECGVIGGSVSYHAASNTSTGDNNIYIYVPQLASTTGTLLLSDASTLDLCDYIVAGDAYAYHYNGCTFNMTGNTSIVVDLSEYSSDDGTTTSFGKTLVGGSISSSSTYAVTTNITGNTSVDIIGSSDVIFTAKVVAGHVMLNYDYGDISGTSSLSISGDSTFYSSVVAGTYSSGATTSSSIGGSDVDISGGVYWQAVVGAHMLDSSSTSGTFSMGDVDANISGGSFGYGFTGGYYNNSGATGTLTLGDVDITWDGGDASTIFGGSILYAETTSLTQGDITIDLNGGTVYSMVAAAGYIGTSSATVTTDSTTVNVSDAVGFTSGYFSYATGEFTAWDNGSVVTVNGGYYGAIDTTTITGNSTLNFDTANSTYDKLDGVTFTNFNVVSVASGSTVDFGASGTPTLLQNLDDSVTKTGSGTLVLAGGNTSSLTVSAGTVQLAATGDSFTSISVASGASLDVSANTSGTLGDLSLSSGSTLIVNAASTGVSLGGGDLSLGTNLTLTLTGDVDSSYDIVLFTDADITDLNWSTLFNTETVGVDASTYLTSSSLDLTNAYLYVTDSGDIAISNDMVLTELYWNGGDNGDWVSGGTDGWYNDGDTTSVAGFTETSSVVFENGNDASISIEDNGVSVRSMRVVDGSYTFTDGDLVVTKSLSLSNSTVTMSGNSADLSAASVTLDADSSLTLGTATTIDTLHNAGTITATSGLTVTNAVTEGGVYSGASLTLTGANSFTSINTGSLTITGEDAGISLSADSTINSLVNSAALSIGSGANVKLLGYGDGAVLTSLSNEGTLNIYANTTIDGAVTTGGTVSMSAYDLSLNSSASFTQLTAGNVTNTTALTLGATVNSITGLSGAGSLTIAEGGSLSISSDVTMTGMMMNSGTINMAGYDLSNSAGGSFGTITVDNITLSNGGGITQITATGTLTTGGYVSISGGGDNSIGAWAGSGALYLSGGSLTVGANSTFSGAYFMNMGTITMANNSSMTLSVATTSGGIVDTNNLTLTGDNTFTQITAAGTVTSSGTLTISGTEKTSIGSLSGGSLAISSADVEIGSVGSLSSFSNGAGTTTITGSGLSAASFSNAGTLNLGSNDLSVTNEITTGGTVTAGNVTLGAAASFTTLTATGTVSNGTSLSLASGSNRIGTLTGGGDLTLTSGSLTIGDASAGIATLSNVFGSTITITSNSTLAALSSMGTLDMTGYDLSITSAVTSGGYLNVNELSLTGDNTFYSITSTGDVNSEGALTLYYGGSMLTLTGEGSVDVKSGDLTVLGTADTVLTSLTAAAKASFGGGLSLGSASSVVGDLSIGGSTLSIGGNLSVGGTLSLATTSTLNLDYQITQTAAITADSLSTDSLDLIISSEYLAGLGLGNTDTYELTDLTNEYLGAVSINGGSDYTYNSSYTVSISVNADGNIELTMAIDGNSWEGGEDGEDGVWSENNEWSGLVTPSESVPAMFTGNGSSNVTIASENVTASMVLVDITEGSATDGYTFQSSDELDENATLHTGNLTVSKGDLDVNGVDIVVSSSEDYVDVSSMGSVIVGSSSEGNDALMTIESNASLTAESLTIFDDYSTDSDDAALSGFVNEGTTTISGAVNASDKSLLNDGNLTIGSGSTIGNLLGTGTTTVSADSTATITALSDETSLVIKEGATLSFNADVTLYEVSNNGTIASTSSVTLAGTIASAGQLNVGSLSIATGEKTEIVDSTIGTLSISDYSSSLLVSGESTISSLDVNYTTLSVAEDAVLTLEEDTELWDIESDGLITLGQNKLTLMTKVSSGGDITANSIIVNAGGSFNDVVTDTLVINTLTAISAMSSYALTTSSSVDYVITADSITGQDVEKVTLDITGLTTSVDDGEYYLLTGSDEGYSWSQFELSQYTLDTVTELIVSEGKDVLYLDDDGSLVLSIETATDRTWVTDENWAVTPSLDDDSENAIVPIIDEATGLLASYDVLDTVEIINVSTTTTIDLRGVDKDVADADDSVKLSNMSGFGSATFTVEGDGADADSVTLTNTKTTYLLSDFVANNVEVNVDNDGSVALTLSSMELNGSNLNVADGANFNVVSLTADAESFISGTVNLTGTAELLGSYDDATLNMSAGATATVDVADASGLTITGTSGTVVLDNASTGTVAAINTTGASIDLGLISSESGLSLAEDSSMVGGSINATMDVDSLVSAINGTGSTAYLFDEGYGLTLNGVTLNIDSTGSDSPVLNLTNNSSTVTILSLADVGASSADVENMSINFTGAVFDKYFSDAYVNDHGYIVATRNDAAYNSMAVTENGAAGLNLVSKALFRLNPEANGVDEDMDKVLADMDSYKAAGNYAAADALASAVAGSSTTSLGSAAVSDLERQLRSIRNRTKMMGVDPSVVNEDMPYFNGWIAAEGGSSTLDADGTSAGHKLNNFGGSVGADVDLNDKLSVGASFTALYGDLTSDGADSAEGDFDTMYGSLFARINSKRWTHSFVATFGAIDATLDRTVSTTSGPYKTKGETDGTAFGLMYEVGYTYALTEDASTCIQPLFNVSLVNSSIGGYTETGSDAALMVGDQDNNYVTFGLGGLLETVVGENMYNRASVLSARAMMKFDAGDRTSEADVTIANNDNYTETVKGAEVGAVGVELGLGITIPVTEEVGAIFMDVSCEFRSGYTNVNGSVGYRFSF